MGNFSIIVSTHNALAYSCQHQVVILENRQSARPDYCAYISKDASAICRIKIHAQILMNESAIIDARIDGIVAAQAKVVAATFVIFPKFLPSLKFVFTSSHSLSFPCIPLFFFLSFHYFFLFHFLFLVPFLAMFFSSLSFLLSPSTILFFFLFYHPMAFVTDCNFSKLCSFYLFPKSGISFIVFLLLGPSGIPLA